MSMMYSLSRANRTQGAGGIREGKSGRSDVEGGLFGLSQVNGHRRGNAANVDIGPVKIFCHFLPHSEFSFVPGHSLPHSVSFSSSLCPVRSSSQAISS